VHRWHLLVLQRWCLSTKFTFNGTSPTNHSCPVRWASEYLTILPLTVLTQWNSVADFLWKVDFYTRNGHFVFLSSSVGGLEAMYAVHLRHHWKARSGLSMSDNWTFFAQCYGWQTMNTASRRFWWGWVTLVQNFRYMGRPPPTICAQLDRPVNVLQHCCWKFSCKETL